MLAVPAMFAAIWIAGGIPPPPPAPVCECDRARAADGWCHVHALGHVAGVPIRSPLLFEILDAHGHQLDPAALHCSACARALAEEGFCEQHRIGFVRDLAYFSRLTYELARGERLRPPEPSCPVCRANARTHGWCDACRRGMAGTVALRDRVSYEAVVDALEILALANAAAERCEHCAVAIVTDADCPFCRIHYRDGHPLPREEPPPETGDGPLPQRSAGAGVTGRTRSSRPSS
jgi:hypothetical protein